MHLTSLPRMSSKWTSTLGGLRERHPEQEEQECRLLQHTHSVGMLLLVEGQVKRATVSPSPKVPEAKARVLLIVVETSPLTHRADIGGEMK